MRGGALIGLGFGLLWWLVGASALGAPWRTPAILLGILLFAAAGWLVLRRPLAPSRTRPRWGYYVAAVVAEIVVIALAQTWLTARGLGTLLLPVVGIVVGAHFIGLWLAFGRRRFLVLAGAMVAINLAALLLPVGLGKRLALSGFGSSAALLATAVLP